MSIAAPSSGGTGEPRAFFDQAESAFARASAGGVIERMLVLAGARLRLRLAGGALVPLLRGLTHLEWPAGGPTVDPGPGLTVCMWDSLSTGVEPPPRPWAAEDQLGRGQIRGFGDERLRVSFLMPHNTLSLFDEARSRAVYRIASHRNVPDHELGAPLRSILHWWTAARGLQMVHAAAVGEGDDGVLLAGRGGSGKSTTALACLGAGLRYAGDDYGLLAEGAGGEVMVHSLYSTGKLQADSIARLSFLRERGDWIGNPDRLPAEKAVFFWAERFPQRIARQLTVRALVLPQVVGAGAPRLVPISGAAGLAALAPSTLLQLPHAAGVALAMLGRVCRRLPCYRLELGADVERAPEVLAGLVRRRGRAE
jgi:hypothetical protein